jgi:hypothetical protein
LSFLKAVMRGGEGGEKFMPKEKEGKGKAREEVDEKQEEARVPDEAASNPGAPEGSNKAQ